MTVCVIVVNFNKADLLHTCLASIQRAAEVAGAAVDTVVVDNGSQDGSLQLVRDEHPDVQLVPLDRNVGFGAAVNVGVRATGAEWVLCLNNDAWLDDQALAALSAPVREDVGAVALQMRFARRQDLINSAGIGVDVHGTAFDRLLGMPVDTADLGAEVFGASAGAALYRRTMLEELNGFDERFFLYLEDVDLAWRARMNGWVTQYSPAAIVYHQHAASAGHGSSRKYFHVGRNRVRLLAKNMDARHLRRHAAGMVFEDLAYVAFVAGRERTLAPLQGRLTGLREWREFRAAAARTRRPVALEPRQGWSAALKRRAAWARGGSAGSPGL